MKSTQSRQPVLAIACGGTGGHFFPGLSIAREFKRHGGSPILFIGGHHADEQIKSAQKVGIAAIASPSLRIPHNPLAWPIAALKYLRCIRENKQLLRHHQVDLALCMGSFACVPMGLAAHKLGLPLFVHEGNACLGRANRLLSRKAHTLFLSLPLVNKEHTKAKQLVVGMPVRTQLREAAAAPLTEQERDAVRESLGLVPTLPVILAFGGSQGAKFLNELLLDTVGKLGELSQRFQLIHLTGGKHNSDYELAYLQAGLKCCVKTRERHMNRLYQASDLVICRAGASTLFELALFGKPSILIPFPEAMDDHQKANGTFVIECGGGRMYNQDAMSPDLLVHEIRDWLQSPATFEEMGEHVQQLARPRAAHTIIETIAEIHGFELAEYPDPLTS